jgi:hypothetical protein
MWRLVMPCNLFNSKFPNQGAPSVSPYAAFSQGKAGTTVGSSDGGGLSDMSSPDAGGLLAGLDGGNNGGNNGGMNNINPDMNNNPDNMGGGERKRRNKWGNDDGNNNGNEGSNGGGNNNGGNNNGGNTNGNTENAYSAFSGPSLGNHSGNNSGRGPGGKFETGSPKRITTGTGRGFDRRKTKKAEQETRREENVIRTGVWCLHLWRKFG